MIVTCKKPNELLNARSAVFTKNVDMQESFRWQTEFKNKKRRIR